MNERLKQLADSAAKYSAVMAMKSDESANELFVEHLVLSVVQECANIAYEVGLHRQTKHEILRRFGLEVTDEN